MADLGLALIGPSVFAVILTLLAAVLRRRVALWVPERKRDVVIFVAATTFLGWAAVQYLIVGSELGTWPAVVVMPLAMALNFALLSFVSLCIHLAQVDGAPGRFLLWLDTTPLYSWIPDDYRYRGYPLWSIITPLSEIRSRS
jgi:hypothetical protein